MFNKKLIIDLLDMFKKIQWYMNHDQTEYSLEDCMERGDLMDQML